MEGTREFVRGPSKRARSRRAPTSSIWRPWGADEVRYVTGEGLAVSFAMDRRVIELCDAIAESRP